jgi:hypothetical protein
MAAAGGHWLKVAQGNVGKLVFVPRGKTATEAITGNRPVGAGFPSSISDVQKIKGLGGSTGASLVQDSAGNLYVMKKGNSAGHLLEESAADSAYNDLGADVPPHKVYDTPSGPVKLAKFVDGQTLAQAQAKDPVKAEQAATSLRRHFAADAVLGNWDVVGLEADNVLISTNGKTYRIDNGGSLRYRAQGGLKKEFSEYPDEIFSMRNHSINPQAAKVFSKVSGRELAGQARSIGKRSNSMIGKLPKAIQGTMKARVSRLLQYSTIHKTLSAKGYSDKAIDGYVTKLWGGLKTGKVKIDPKTPADVLKSFTELGG